MMNVGNMKKYYPDIYDENFQEIIASKLEFRLLGSPINLFPHQEFVRRYMSPFTPYKYLILYHGLGSGKTIAAISVAIDHYRFNKKICIIVTRGQSAEDNFRGEIKKYCNLFGIDDYRKIFKFYHYISIANKIKFLPEKGLCDIFSNKICIMDEIHNMREFEIGGTLYNICTAINKSVNSKFIYCTATPMTNSVDQIISLLKLTDRVLPEKYDLQDIKYALRGIISSTKSIDKKPREIYEGNCVIDGITCVVSHMQGHQKDFYQTASVNTESDFYKSLSHASLFCLPNGAYGGKITKYTNKRIEDHEYISILNGQRKSMKISHHVIEDEFEECLTTRLGDCSSKYKCLIDIIENTTGKVFIFLEDVIGSGIFIINNILEAYGFELYVGGTRPLDEHKKRYTFCVGDLKFSPNNDEKVEAFNDERNINGDCIRILIGSRVIGESITLTEVRHFHFMAPHWNMSMLNQAKGRVIREGSHNRLDEDNRDVRIYIHIAVLEGYLTIDQYKLNIATLKQVKISVIEHILDEIAVDKYCYDPIQNFSELDIRIFSVLYIGDYICEYIDIITKIVPCDIRVAIDKMGIPDSLAYAVIYYIVSNNVIINNKYLRYSPSLLYWVADRTLPFCEYPMIESNFCSIEIHSEKFRELSVAHKIYTLEKAFIDKDIEFLESISELFIFLDNKYYHLLHYKNTKKSYIATTAIPRELQGKTRVFDEKSWRYLSIDEEKDIMPIFTDIYDKFFKYIDSKIVYGLLSVMDNKVRVRLGGNSEDKRLVKRGRVLDTWTKRDLEQLVNRLGLNVRITKKELVEDISCYMFENFLVSYI